MRDAHEERLIIIQTKTTQLAHEHSTMFRSMKKEHATQFIVVERNLQLELERNKRRNEENNRCVSLKFYNNLLLPNSIFIYADFLLRIIFKIFSTFFFFFQLFLVFFF